MLKNYSKFKVASLAGSDKRVTIVIKELQKKAFVKNMLCGLLIVCSRLLLMIFLGLVKSPTLFMSHL